MYLYPSKRLAMGILLEYFPLLLDKVVTEAEVTALPKTLFLFTVLRSTPRQQIVTPRATQFMESFGLQAVCPTGTYITGKSREPDQTLSSPRLYSCPFSEL